VVYLRLEGSLVSFAYVALRCSRVIVYVSHENEMNLDLTDNGTPMHRFVCGAAGPIIGHAGFS